MQKKYEQFHDINSYFLENLKPWTVKVRVALSDEIRLQAAMVEKS